MSRLLTGRMADASTVATAAVWPSTRITTSPHQMAGVPCLRSLRIPVATVVRLVAEGQTTEDILALYPDLEAEDVREALLFAAEPVRDAASPRGWAKIWAHEFSGAANHSGINTFRGSPSLPWAQRVAGSNPVAPTTFPICRSHNRSQAGDEAGGCAIAHASRMSSFEGMAGMPLKLTCGFA